MAQLAERRREVGSRIAHSGSRGARDNGVRDQHRLLQARAWLQERQTRPRSPAILERPVRGPLVKIRRGSSGLEHRIREIILSSLLSGVTPTTGVLAGKANEPQAKVLAKIVNYNIRFLSHCLETAEWRIHTTACRCRVMARESIINRDGSRFRITLLFRSSRETAQDATSGRPPCAFSTPPCRRLTAENVVWCGTKSLPAKKPKQNSTIGFRRSRSTQFASSASRSRGL